MWKWILGGAVVYGILVYLDQKTYGDVASACSAQHFPNVTQGSLSVPQMGAGPWCAQYNTWESQWGWFQPFVPHIEL